MSVISKYSTSCPLDHSTFEKYQECNCNFATPFEVWNFKNQEIEKLKEENKDLQNKFEIANVRYTQERELVKKLKEENEKLRNALSFYADKQIWQTPPDSKKPCFNDCIMSIDVERIQTSKTSWFYVAGKLARQTLKELGE